MKEIELAHSRFENALAKLESGIESAEGELGRDAVIKRFEFTFEAFWKFLKVICAREGIEVKSPRSAIKSAFRLGILEKADHFLDALMDRNRTTHIYDEQTAEAIYSLIKTDYADAFRNASGEIDRFLA